MTHSDDQDAPADSAFTRPLSPDESEVEPSTSQELEIKAEPGSVEEPGTVEAPGSVAILDPAPAAADRPSPEESRSEPDPVSPPVGFHPISEETRILYELVGDGHILTVVVLIGASALLPVPFLDDVAKAYLERRLARTIAEGEGLTLSAQEVERLTLEPAKGCCMWGCLGKIVIYPIKRLIRKILFFLEIKRAVDQSSTALAEAWLLTLAMRRGLWSTGRDISETDRLREVIDVSCQSHGVKPLETAFAHAFRGAKDTLMDFAGRFTGKLDDDKEKLDAAVRKLELEEGERLARLSKRLKEALSEVGEVYLQGFACEFERQMETARSRPQS
jgi:hypothetical protein